MSFTKGFFLIILRLFLLSSTYIKESSSVSENDQGTKSDGGLRSLLIENLQDSKACSLPATFKEFIIGDVKEDRSGWVWWSTNCPIVIASASSDSPRPSENTSSKGISKGQQEKLDRLIKAAKCKPLKTMVTLEPTNPSHQYFPCQVAVKRCSGCCNAKRMQCLPTQTKIRKFLVLVLENNAQSTDKYSLPEEKDLVTNVEVEEHKKCSCQCKVRSSDCTKHQKYDKKNCKCTCPKTKKKCSSKKVWSEELCSCVCHSHKECSTGLKYNEKKCRCEEISELTVDYSS